MKSLFRFATLAIILSAYSRAPQSGELCINPEEQKLYDLLMEYRHNNDLKSIPLSSRLTTVAQLHAKDLSDNHGTVESNCNIHSWSTKGNWKPCCYTDDHNEAACMWNKPREIAGYEGTGFEIAYYSSSRAKAAEGLEVWKKSPGHNAVIVNGGIWKKMSWNAIGIGIYGDYGVVWFGENKDGDSPKKCK